MSFCERVTCKAHVLRLHYGSGNPRRGPASADTRWMTSSVSSTCRHFLTHIYTHVHMHSVPLSQFLVPDDETERREKTCIRLDAYFRWIITFLLLTASRVPRTLLTEWSNELTIHSLPFLLFVTRLQVTVGKVPREREKGGGNNLLIRRDPLLA